MTSPRVFLPSSGRLRAANGNSHVPLDRVAGLETDIKSLISQPHYPCVAALRSYHKDDYQVGFYSGFGTGISGEHLREDLDAFLTAQRQSRSPYLTYWAVFDGDESRDEERFENEMWNELSHITSFEDSKTDWPEGVTTDPNDKAFCFHLFGEAFFVVGLHSRSSRASRRFRHPTLIFNIFSQFRELDRQSLYHPMVKTNRARDTRFQGSPNPMSVRHGDDWETIQFSGRTNSDQWKCPFHFLFRSRKTRSNA